MRKAVKSNLLLRIWGNEVIMTTDKDTRERGELRFFYRSKFTTLLYLINP